MLPISGNSSLKRQQGASDAETEQSKQSNAATTAYLLSEQQPTASFSAANPSRIRHRVIALCTSPNRSNKSEGTEGFIEQIYQLFKSITFVGSKKPFVDLPVWITPDVIRGGFATRNLPAGGALTGFEKELAKDLAKEDPTIKRAIETTDESTIEFVRSKINAIWWSSEKWHSTLVEMLETGHYRINTTEEGVMLTALALMKLNKADKAKALMAEITPFAHEVRFFPQPADRPMKLDRKVALVKVSDLVAQLERYLNSGVAHRTNTCRRIEKNAVVFREWLPLKDELISLLAETVEGDLPYYDEYGALCGGTPLADIAPNWRIVAWDFLERRDEVLTKYSADLLHQSNKKRGSERMLLRALKIALANPIENLGNSEQKDFQKIQQDLKQTLAQINKKNALKQEDREQRQQERSEWLKRFELKTENLEILVKQLRTFENDAEVSDSDLESILQSEPAISLGREICRKIARLKPRTVEKLLEDGEIPSSEVLASVILKQVPIILSEGIADPKLSRLFAQILLAFNERRSLLLFNLEAQVKQHEIPCIRYLREVLDLRVANEKMENTIKDLVKLTFTHFPQTILTNVFIKSLGQLIGDLPYDSKISKMLLTHELAADIFEEAFSARFLKSAKDAAGLMRGTLYERYYNLDYCDISKLENPEQLYDLCMKLSGINKSIFGWLPTHLSGKIIEWQQIITTHNMAMLVVTLDLQEYVEHHGKEICEKIALWIVSKFTNYNPDMPDYIRLREHKNIAYALRQLLFFLSFQTENIQKSILSELEQISSKLERVIEKRKIKESKGEAEKTVVHMGSSVVHFGKSEDTVEENLANKKRNADEMLMTLRKVINNEKSVAQQPFLGWL